MNHQDSSLLIFFFLLKQKYHNGVHDETMKKADYIVNLIILINMQENSPDPDNI